MKLLTCSSAVLLLAAVGCADEHTYSPVPNANIGVIEAPAPGQLAVTNGRVGGEFGPYRVANGPSSDISSYRDEYTTDVTIQRSEPGAMGMLIVHSNRDLTTVPAGRYSLDTYEESVTVCGGPSNESIDFDVAASTGEVVVTDRPDGQRDIEVVGEVEQIDSYTGMPTGQTQVATGSFTVQPSLR
jgi:hypothetical protein